MIFKKTILLFITIVGIYAVTNAQCDKKLKLKTERVYEVKAGNVEGETIPITAEIILSADSIVVFMKFPEGSTSEVRGKNTKTVCKMNKNYTEGTIDFITDAEVTAHGRTSKSKMFFSLESKGGKIKLYGSPEDEKDKLCFVIKDKEEIK